MSVYEEYLNYRLTGRCSNPFWQRKFGGMSGGGGDTPGGGDVELLSWEGVAYHIKQGDYKDAYKIGDEVPVDLGSEGIINMQIAAFDADTLADGSGTAAISWVGKELLPTAQVWNQTSYTAGVERTGTLGGWLKSYLREYLNNTVSGLIPENVLEMVVPVTKTHYSYNLNEFGYYDTSSETLWVPSDDECFDTSGLYHDLFPTADSRKKNYIGSPFTATKWWLRDANDKRYAKHVGDAGNQVQTYVTNKCRIALGFCTGKTPT
jgi:hypothetical protein